MFQSGSFFMSVRSVIWSKYDGVIIIPPFLSLFISFILFLKMFVVSSIMSSVVVVVVMLPMMTCVVKDDMMWVVLTTGDGVGDGDGENKPLQLLLSGDVRVGLIVGVDLWHRSSKLIFSFDRSNVLFLLHRYIW